MVDGADSRHIHGESDFCHTSQAQEVFQRMHAQWEGFPHPLCPQPSLHTPSYCPCPFGWVPGSKSSEDATVKILPRFYFDGWTKENLEMMLSSSASASQAVSLVLDECTRNGYDGVVLDAWLGWYATGALADVGMRKKAQAFVILLSSYLEAEHRELILAVPPLSPDYEERIAAAREKGGLAAATAAAHRMPFTPEDFTALFKHVRGFSLMTYDFSGVGNVGPAGPLWWQSLNVQILINHAVSNAWTWGESYARRAVEDVAKEIGGKILLGLNMYGINYELPTSPHGKVSGSHLVGSQYLDILRQHRPTFQWDDTAKEHVFDYSPAPGTTRRVYYPTLMSLQNRLELVREMHLGVSMWEIGQGLDYFYDLL
eukprot:jgi/Mesvir1/28763/Mv19730-RA.1